MHDDDSFDSPVPHAHNSQGTGQSSRQDAEFWDGLSTPPPDLTSLGFTSRSVTAASDPAFDADWTPTLADIAAAESTTSSTASSTGTLDPDYVASLHLLSKFPPAEHEAVRAKLYRDADGTIRTRHRLMRLVSASVPSGTRYERVPGHAERPGAHQHPRQLPEGLTVDFSQLDDDSF